MYSFRFCIQAIIIISFCPRLSVPSMRAAGRAFLLPEFPSLPSHLCSCAEKTAHKIVFRRADALFACSVFRAYIEPVFHMFRTVGNGCTVCSARRIIVSTVLENTEGFPTITVCMRDFSDCLFPLLSHLPLRRIKNALILAAVLCLTSLTLLAFRNNAKAARTAALCVCTVLGVGVNVF